MVSEGSEAASTAAGGLCACARDIIAEGRDALVGPGGSTAFEGGGLAHMHTLSTCLSSCPTPFALCSCPAGASPAIELQSMGSMLGGDGQWLFGELSTGAIGALSPAGLLLRQPFEPEDQQQQGQLQQQREQQQQQQGQQEAATVALAAPVPVSSALPAISSSTAPSCSLPLVPAAGGAFGFGFAGAPAGAAAAAAAAAAKLCLFDSGFASAAGAPQQGQPTQPMQQANGSGPQPADAAAAPGLALPLPAGNNISAFSRSSWSSGSSRGVSASLPRISPNRSSLCGVPGADGVMRLGDPRQQQQQPYRPSQHGG
jgi:hypothetical protein